MKYFTIWVILLSLVGCCKNPNPAPEEKYFDIKDLSNLSLDSLRDFWENDSLSTRSNYFDFCSLGGVGFKDNNGNSIGVAVFESQEKAIFFMELRIDEVSGLILPGDPNEFITGKWWYGYNVDGTFNNVYVNQWNTIIEASTFSTSNYVDIETKLFETTSEIAKRVDSLSR